MPALRILLVVGTRPEAIKLAPVALQCRRTGMRPIVCLTGQHRDLVAPVVEHFGLAPRFDLGVMRPRQSLGRLAARCLARLDGVIARTRPDWVVAQGDTTTAMTAALAAFYRQTPFVHVEAGLRSGALTAPWPEEYHRRVAAVAAAIHCAPTPRAVANLEAEGVPPEQILLCGNTVVDALQWTLRQGRPDGLDRYAFLADRPMVLMTCHRRENVARLPAICAAVRRLAERFAGTAFVVPMHPNPTVGEAIAAHLAGVANVHLVAPATYPQFLFLLNRAMIVLSDSGGVQEEAVALGRPVLVMRDNTERPEGVEAGAAELVGADAVRIVGRATRLLGDPNARAAMVGVANPYGDGRAAERIVDAILARSQRPRSRIAV